MALASQKVQSLVHLITDASSNLRKSRMEKIMAGITVQKVQCSGCKQFFVSDTIFDYHRVGDSRKDTRRCLSTDEMIGVGLTTERRQVRMILEGVEYFEEHDVWFSPAARERVRQAFGKQAIEDENE